MESLLDCANAKRPDNTLFPDLSSFCIGFSDLETYLPLVLGLFELAPLGSLVEIIPFFLVNGVHESNKCLSFGLTSHLRGFLRATLSERLPKHGSRRKIQSQQGKVQEGPQTMGSK